MKLLNLFLMMVVLSACKPQSSKVLQVQLGSILEPVSITLSTSPNIGEIVTSDESRDITITIKNNSSELIKYINFNIGYTENLLDFKINNEGASIFPGADGTCQQYLDPGQECTIVLSLTPRKQGEFNFLTTLSYMNKVETQSKNIEFQFFSGKPASLVFTNELTTYNFGTLEQTQPTESTQTLEIVNAGGLTAKSLSLELINDGLSNAYRLISHNCPKDLKIKQKCKAVVGFTPKNNNYTDPEEIFTGSIRYNYTKDPEFNQQSLNGFFSFTSTTIEARFKTNYPNLDFGNNITAGNKSTKTIKITNMGYREGSMKKLLFKKNNNSVAAECIKSNSSTLDCGNNASLYDFPFKINDLNNCLEKNIPSFNDDPVNASCNFQITYWPSKEYRPSSQPIHNFDQSSISVVYDSNWKGQPNIVSRDKVFYPISANFLSRGILELNAVTFDDEKLSTNDIVMTSDSLYSAKLGTIAKINSGSDATYFIKLTYRNIGETSVSFNQLRDSKPTPNIIFNMGDDLSLSYNLNSYYPDIRLDKNSCEIIDPSKECTLTYYLKPTVNANEDQLMYDDVSNIFTKFKSFNFSYIDGVKFNDDGSLSQPANLETRMISKLVAKGKIQLASNLIEFNKPESQMTGSSRIRHIILKNIGTGDITALQFDSLETLEVTSANTNNPPNLAALNKPHFPYRISSYASNSESLPSGTQKDCFNLIRSSNEAFKFSIDPNKTLPDGESCALRVESKMPLNASTLTSTVPFLDNFPYRRHFTSTNSEYYPWMIKNLSPLNSNIFLKVHYWDGYINEEDPINSDSDFGYKTLGQQVTIKNTWAIPASFHIARIEPVGSSLLNIPAITYPEINETYPSITKLAEDTNSAKETTFTNAQLSYIAKSTPISGNVLNSVSIENNFPSTLKDSNNAVVFLGSTKINSKLHGTLYFENIPTSTTSAKDISIEDNGGDPGFTILNFQNIKSNIFSSKVTNLSSIFISFEVNQSTPGFFRHCYKLNYFNGLGNQVYPFCVSFQALDNIADIAINYKNWDVTYNKDTATYIEIPDTNFTSINLKRNKISTCDNDIYSNCGLSTDSSILKNQQIHFFTTTSESTCFAGKSCQYDKKTVRITNTGDLPITSFNLDIIDRPSGYSTNKQKYELSDTECSQITSNFKTIASKISYCKRDVTNCNNLAVGASCDINFYYLSAADNNGESTSMISINYKTDQIFSTNYFIPLKTESQKSAVIAMDKFGQGQDLTQITQIPTTGQTVVNTSYQSDKIDPSASGGFGLNLGTYKLEPNREMKSAFILNDFISANTYYATLKTSSSMRVSFLAANKNASTSGYSQIYPEWDESTSSFKTYPSTTGASRMKMSGSPGCFYGDVATLPENERGFNKDSPIGTCIVKIDILPDFNYLEKDGNKPSIGGNISSSVSTPYFYTIPHYSYKRSVKNNFKLYFTGFVEPIRSQASGKLTNLNTTYISATSASISFTLPNITALNPGPNGSIRKYRVLWTSTLNSSTLQSPNIFSVKMNATGDLCYQDFDDLSQKNITISTCTINSSASIIPGKYYYIKILAIRDLPSNHTLFDKVQSYVSDPKIPLGVIASAPNSMSTFIPAQMAFVDHNIISKEILNLSKAKLKCQDSFIKLKHNSTDVSNYRSLMNWNIFNLIRNTIVPTDFGTGSLYSPIGGVGSLPHWLNESAVAINSNMVRLYNGNLLSGGFPNFVTTKTNDYNDQYKISYSKPCTNNTCNNLFPIAGGDDEDTSSNAVNYTLDTYAMGYARCYIPVACPFNPGTKASPNKLDSAACALPY